MRPVEAPAAPAEAPTVPAKTPAVPAEARTKAKKKKTKKVPFDACVLGDKPIRPKVAALPKPPPKKEMFLDGVSTNKSGKEAKGAAMRGAAWPAAGTVLISRRRRSWRCVAR